MEIVRDTPEELVNVRACLELLLQDKKNFDFYITDCIPRHLKTILRDHKCSEHRAWVIMATETVILPEMIPEHLDANAIFLEAKLEE